MAKKRDDQIGSEGQVYKPVRCDLLPADHDRLEKVCRARGLSKSSYARMVLLEAIRVDEAKL